MFNMKTLLLVVAAFALAFVVFNLPTKESSLSVSVVPSNAQATEPAQEDVQPVEQPVRESAQQEPGLSEEERRSLLLSAILDYALVVETLPPTPEQFERVLKSIFDRNGELYSEHGLKIVIPEDAEWIFSDLLGMLWAFEEEREQRWSVQSRQVCILLTAFMAAISQNREIEEFRRFIGPELEGRLVAQIFENFTALHPDAANFLGERIAAYGMLTEGHLAQVRELLEYDPPLRGIDGLLEALADTDAGERFLLALSGEDGLSASHPEVYKVAFRTRLATAAPQQAKELAEQFFAQAQSQQAKVAVVNEVAKATKDAKLVFGMASYSSQRSKHPGDRSPRVPMVEYTFPLRELLLAGDLSMQQMADILLAEKNPTSEWVNTWFGVLGPQEVDLCVWILDVYRGPNFGDSSKFSTLLKHQALNTLAGIAGERDLKLYVDMVPGFLKTNDPTLFMLAADAARNFWSRTGGAVIDIPGSLLSVVDDSTRPLVIRKIAKSQLLKDEGMLDEQTQKSLPSL